MITELNKTTIPLPNQIGGMLTLNGYGEIAETTAIYPAKSKLVYPILGLAGEAGEMANKYNNIIRDNQGIISEENRMKLLHELGDILWYANAIAKDLGSDLNEVGIMNLNKLQTRKLNNTITGSGDVR